MMSIEKMIYLHHAPLTSIMQDGTVSKRVFADYRERILSDFCGDCDLPKPAFAKDEYGKPYCTNIAHLHFNHSHSQSDYALIYSLTVQNIGVDIENIHRQVNFDGLAKRYFHQDEYHHWQKNGYDKNLWFAYWTIKEAVLKASGIGIRMPLNQLNAIFINQDSGYVNHQHIGKFYFKQRIINDNIISIAYPFEYKDRPIIGCHSMA